MLQKDKYSVINIRKYLESDDAKLLSFYNDNKFVKFDTRQTTSKDQESHELVQLLRLL